MTMQDKMQNEINALQKQIDELNYKLGSAKKAIQNITMINGKEWMQYPMYMNYQETFEFCEKLGDGWRMPLVHELMGLYDFVNDKSLLSEHNQCYHNTSHWTATGQVVGLSCGNFYKSTAHHKNYYALYVRDI